MARSQFRGGVVVDMSMEINQPWGKRNDRAVGEDQFQSCIRFHAMRVFDQRDPKTMVKRHATPIMIAAHEIQFAVELRNQCFGIFLFPQRQVSKVEDYFIRANPMVPAFNDQILPPIRPATILADIFMEEVGIRDKPSLIIKWEVVDLIGHKDQVARH